MAGKTILAKAILTSTPVYTLQSTLLPMTLCSNIDKKIRQFIEGGSQDNRRIHLVRWETVTRMKEIGGLGVRGMRNMNLAFMAKLGWRLLTKPNDLWAKVLHFKYIRGKVALEKI